MWEAKAVGHSAGVFGGGQAATRVVALPGVDPVTTMFEMIPLMLLFEGSIWLAVVFERRWRPELRTALTPAKT